MLETLHRIGSRVRNSKLLRRQRWLWSIVEPAWQCIFHRATRRCGYATHINDDVFRLEYGYGSRYDRRDKRSYEPTFYLPFVERLKPGMTVFDIGAHIGIFSLAAAKRVGPAGKVFAFEPAPETVRTLERHVAMNGFRDRIEVVQAAVSDREGSLSFFCYRESMAASISRRNVEDLNPEKRVEPARELQVPSLTLDAFCRERGLCPDVLKIDIEGAEALALNGASDLLSRSGITILCEIHPRQMSNCGSSIEELTGFLSNLGYSIVPLDPPNPMGIFHALIKRRAS
jgi:FkbM family methyltransferase